jgi:hypothetical protein
MQPPAPPKITAVEVVAAQPTEADSMAIARLSADTNRSLPQVAYVVKVRLREKPPATSMAWRLYVNDELIPKYWEDRDGIYFTVLDPQFFVKHKGKRLRFSQDGVDFFDTGMRLAAPPAPAAAARSRARATRTSKGKAARSGAARAASRSARRRRGRDQR